MCGITGVWNTDGRPVDEAELTAMTALLAHRGPDGRGLYRNGPVGLGHHRLAILDPGPSGHQPMSFGEGRYWITYNGEIYNFLELKEDLQGRGCSFATGSDTEVILAAYEIWGESCQERFNGMWAFAIWDAAERLLFLSRDRFGVKPLHYCHDGRRFAFASEMKAFLALDGRPLEFDPGIVAAALVDANSIEGSEMSIIKGIKRLPGGHCLTVREGRPPVVRRWWNTMEHIGGAPDDLDGQAEKFRELFSDACRIRMRSDVPIATALSGGLDSSSVLCSMARVRRESSRERRLAREWQKAFVVSFPGTVQDERRYAEEAVRSSGAVPVFVSVDQGEMIDCLDDALFKFEEIYDMPLAAWFLYRAMRRQGVAVSLDGHGGDELLAGYHHHLELAMEDSLWPWPRPRRLKQLRATLNHMYPGGAPAGCTSVRHLMTGRLRKNLSQWPGLRSSLRGIMRPFREIPPLRPPHAWLRRSPDSPGPLPADVTHGPPFRAGLLGRGLYLDFHQRTLPTILRNVDRVSMAHGVEVRAPFMDWRLVNFCFSLPDSSKIGEGYTKLVLRESMRGILPETIRTRKGKVGFAAPLADWFGGPLRAFILDSVHSRSFLESGIWDGKAVRRYVGEAYRDEAFPLAREIWTFIQAMRVMVLFTQKKDEIARARKGAAP